MRPISNAKKRAEYLLLAARDGGEICQWCGRGPTEEIPLTIHHIDPNGGEALENKQLLCLPCNSQEDATEDKTVRWVSGLWQRGFTIVPNMVVDSDVLSVYAHRVYTLLLYYARQDDACWAGQEGLAVRAKCSERQVREAIRDLERAGLVRTRRRGQGKTNVYILLVPRLARGSALGKLGSEAGADQERNDLPKEVEALKQTSSSSSARQPKKVGGKTVTSDEHDLVDTLLARFNELAGGKRFGGRSWRESIIRRMREHPEVTAMEHLSILDTQFERPWWKGDPTPSVIWGNDRVFDRALNGTQAEEPDPLKVRYTRV